MCKVYGHGVHGHGEFTPMAFFKMNMGGMAKKMMSHIKGCMTHFEGWIPYDIEDFDNYYMISIPLPGISKENVKVSLISNSLNIKVKRPTEVIKSKTPEDKEDEIRSGAIAWKDLLNFIWKKDVNLDIPLPPDINNETIKSKINNGLLKVRIDKIPPKRINIDTVDNIN